MLVRKKLQDFNFCIVFPRIQRTCMHSSEGVKSVIGLLRPVSRTGHVTTIKGQKSLHTLKLFSYVKL